MTFRKHLRWPALALIAVVAWLVIRQSGEAVTVQRDGLTFAAGALARDLAADEPREGTRVMRRFRLGDGTACTVFARGELSGIACTERSGWHVRTIRDGVTLDDPAQVARIDEALSAAAEEMQSR